MESLLTGMKHALLVGAGGGYDILGAVALMTARALREVPVTLASLTFTSVKDLPEAQAHDEAGTLWPLAEGNARSDLYCPEAWLAGWLQAQGRGDRVWCLRKAGVEPLRCALQLLADHCGADTLILVDGGVDLILRGDETSIGTPTEDLAMLAAARRVRVGRRLVACLGFGSELRDGIRHAQALARMAELRRLGGFLGASMLDEATAEGRAYASALAHVQDHQQGVRTSHVQRVVLGSARGEFGGEGDVWLSPLSALVWYFDLDHVADSHLFLQHLDGTETAFEVTVRIQACRRDLRIQEASSIPL